jgi:hypothetical protein
MREEDSVRASNLIRWGGLAAFVAAGLYIMADFVALFSILGEGSNVGFLFRSVVAAVGGVLLLLGLVALYARQLEETGIPGLVGFLEAIVGLVLVQRGFIWASVLASLGWALFGGVSLGAQVYPVAAAMLLIIGAILSGAANALTGSGLLANNIFFVVGALIVDMVFNAAIGWLGINLFMKRSEEV